MLVFGAGTGPCVKSILTERPGGVVRRCSQSSGSGRVPERSSRGLIEQALLEHQSRSSNERRRAIAWRTPASTTDVAAGRRAGGPWRGGPVRFQGQVGGAARS